MNNTDVISDMISLIIPVYNRENVIKECIFSVLSQNYQNFEIVIVDDGSSDKTFEICQELANEEPRIKLLKTEHTGVSAARNKGIDIAKGEYIFFLDSDDVIHPFLLGALFEGMKCNNADIGGTCVVNVLEKYWYKVEQKLAEKSVKGETVFKSNEESLNAIFLGSSPLNVIGGVMMRRDLIKETRFRTDLFIGEDYYFIYENLIKNASSVFLKQKWYYCRIHTNNSSWNYSFSGFWTRFYRRELVWKSEEAFGRTEYTNIQKRDAFGCFLRCFQENRPYCADSRKMCKILRKYKRELLPAMKSKIKLLYFACAYLPLTSWIALKFKNKLNLIIKQIRRERAT